MKISTKLTLIFSIFIFLSYTAIFFILSTVTESNFKLVSHDVHYRTMDTMYEIVETELSQLEVLLNDWANWDASYDFVKGDYPEYVEDNLPIEVYDEASLDYIIITDEDNEIIYGSVMDFEAYELLEVPPEVADLLTGIESGTGIVAYGDAFIAFSSTEVTDNSGEIESGGRMIHAFNISDDYFEELNQSLGYEMLASFGAPDALSAEGTEAVVGAAENDYGINVGLQLFGNVWVGSIELPIMNQDRSIYLTTELDNAIYELGQKQKVEISLMVLTSLTVMLFIMLIAIRRLVIARVEKLNKEVEAITLSGSIKERVEIHGKDELGKLSDGINNMLMEIDSMHQEVSHLASVDELTQVYNRRYGYEMLEKTIGECKANEKVLTVAFIDINDLKVVNDTLGHNYGDMLIKEVVQLVKLYKAEEDYLVRMGGDEFLYVMPGKDGDEAEQGLKSLTVQASASNNSLVRKYKLSFSYGTAVYESGMTTDQLIEEADKLMYVHKKKSKALKNND